MLITSDQIRSELGLMWPDLQFIVLSDPAWLPTDKAQLQAELDACPRRPRGPIFIENLWACEENAIDLVLTVRKRRAEAAQRGEIPTSQWFNRPLGFVAGTRFNGRDMNHFANICRTRAGWLMIEPQTHAIWTPRSDTDDIYFLFM
ncbi:MAG: hypothetical protein VR64_20580 [Desulfatitalea sp. BRH_c12]|nr:MAG: hypothetical protein VR64_20580 [Desulfatitalea sp. BRH_c12]